ncbi:cilia- and flagella-associated protein 206-like isoform X3 [Planococcus citri]|uniref:cilia- and flagella-associated protein 206-like isoform X3 n=1 Tax=Planococcus citri TaxID=170843 RepID=UPI0031F79082
MNNLSESLFSSICRSIKKECIIKSNTIPHDRVLFYLMKLFTLAAPRVREDENDTKKYAEFIIDKISSFLMSNHVSMVTIEIQIYFDDHHISKEAVLEKRQQIVQLTTDGFLQHILQKRITKNKEDSDQLYHLISCYIVLFSGAGDPTDDEVLKETTVALKSILSTKELVRFASKANSVKEVQLGDVCSIVTGIRIFNQDSAKKSANESELFSPLQKALQKCNNFLEGKSREMEERSERLIKICLLYRDSSSEDRNIEEINKIKAYVVLLQQILFFFRILIQECHMLNEEFQECCVILDQRLTRVRKTVKSRTAIPVVEIYVSEPNLENWSPEMKLSLSNQTSKDVISVENRDCTLITSENADDFYNILVEYNGYCVVTFVEEEGIVTPGIKEYGLIKYKDKHYCFSTTVNASKFCLRPEK